MDTILGDAQVVGAAYGAIQAVCQVLLLVLPSHTVAWKIAKYLTSGPARPAPSPVGSFGG